MDIHFTGFKAGSDREYSVEDPKIRKPPTAEELEALSQALAANYADRGIPVPGVTDVPDPNDDATGAAVQGAAGSGEGDGEGDGAADLDEEDDENAEGANITGDEDEDVDGLDGAFNAQPPGADNGTIPI